MSKWRVYNKHRDGLTHKEKYKDEMIEIKAGEYVLMDYEDAVQFRSQYFPMKVDAMNVQLPESYKMIQIEPHTAEALVVESKKFVCQMDGREFPSQAELDAYTKQNFGEQVYVDETLEKELKQSVVTAPKRGRPQKEKTL